MSERPWILRNQSQKRDFGGWVSWVAAKIPLQWPTRLPGSTTLGWSPEISQPCLSVLTGGPRPWVTPGIATRNPRPQSQSSARTCVWSIHQEQCAGLASDVKCTGIAREACSVLSANMHRTSSFFSTRGQKILIETSRNMALHPSPMCFHSATWISNVLYASR